MCRPKARSAILHLLKYSRSAAIYSDPYAVFRGPESNKHMTGITQFGRANRTLQDRPVKELRLADLSSVEDGNVFLEGFADR